MLPCTLKTSTRLWICFIVSMHLIAVTTAQTFDVKCVKCGDDGDDTTDIRGIENENLTLKFTVVAEQFFTLIIKFNKSDIAATPNGITVNTPFQRIHVLAKKEKGTYLPKKDGDTYTFSIKLSKLSLMYDTNRRFKYELMNHLGKKTTSESPPLEVIAIAGIGASNSGSGSSTLIVIIVLAVIIISTIAVLGLLYSKDIIPTDSCKARLGGGRSGRGEESKVPFQTRVAEPQTEYAELGPGGGHLGPRAPPPKSNYAQVKTDGVHYPPQQPEGEGIYEGMIV